MQIVTVIKYGLGASCLLLVLAIAALLYGSVATGMVIFLLAQLCVLGSFVSAFFCSE
jgi:hypothetical protein